MRRNQSQDHVAGRLFKPKNLPSVPKASERLKLNERQNKNLVKDNMMNVILDNSKAQKIKAKAMQKERSEQEMKTHKNYGKVPNYINKFNQRREDAEI